MSEWQPIETAPENVLILVFAPIGDGEIIIDKFRWVEYYEDTVESVSHHKDGSRRRIITETKVRERDWDSGAGLHATHWLPLPAPPEKES